jgi:hypothetical protein
VVQHGEVLGVKTHVCGRVHVFAACVDARGNPLCVGRLWGMRACVHVTGTFLTPSLRVVAAERAIGVMQALSCAAMPCRSVSAECVCSVSGRVWRFY